MCRVVGGGDVARGGVGKEGEEGKGLAEDRRAGMSYDCVVVAHGTRNGRMGGCLSRLA